MGCNSFLLSKQESHQVKSREDIGEEELFTKKPDTLYTKNQMKITIPAFVILSLMTLYSCIGKDKYPKYPFLPGLVDQVENLQYVSTPYSREIYSKGKQDRVISYGSFPVNGQSLYLVRGTCYNLFGDSVVHYNFKEMLPEGGSLTYEQMIKGEYIFRYYSPPFPSFGLFNMETKEIENSVLVIDYSIFLEHLDINGGPGRSDLVNTLQKIDFNFPIPLGKRPFAKNYEKHTDYLKASKKYEKDLKNAYENAVNDFINRKRKDIYMYHSYSDGFGEKVPCLVFADQYIAFKVHGNIEKEGFPDYLKPIIKWSSWVDDPVVSFRKTEEAYLGTHIELVASLVPLPQNEYMYYYELMCDNQAIHFKSKNDNITLYDFYQRDKKIYFVLKQGNDMILFEYDRL